MQILLLPLGGHAHLAEPGCLCTKQALIGRIVELGSPFLCNICGEILPTFKQYLTVELMFGMCVCVYAFPP